MDFRVAVFLVLCASLAPAHMTINPENRIMNVTGPFYLKLYQVLDQKKNLVFSPKSVADALHILYEAASEKTEKDLLDALKPYPTLQPPKNIKSSLKESGGVTFYQTPVMVYAADKYNLNVTWLTTLENKFDADFDEHTDFTKPNETATAINQWIATTTEHDFKEMVRPCDLKPNTKVLPVTIADFYLVYRKEFHPKATSKQTFYVNDTVTKQVDMMHMDNETLYVRTDDTLDAKILQFKHFDKNFELSIFLPNKRGNIEDMKKKLFAENSESIHELLKSTELRVVNLALPKFVMTSTIDLYAGLDKLGLDEMYSTNATFPSFGDYHTKMPNLIVQDVLHETFINVTESETVATGVTVERLIRKPKTPQPTDDPPMYFVPLEHFNNPSRKKRSSDDSEMDFMAEENLSIPSKTERPSDEPALDFIVDHPFVFISSHIKVPDGLQYLAVGQVYNPTYP